MAQITVSKYLQLIDELIDESRLAEAVTHSRHLLEQHPRHIDTYRSMGKALLEQGDYAGAADIFQRVLSALPADFVAHAGLAIIHKAGDRWKQALWHMERAFEVEPYNGAIRAELQELYGRRDGLAPQQVELTRGALARLYVKGGLYQQAILELRALLAEEPERVDLKLLLAEAHWRAEERVEAAEQCEALLEVLPDCIDAHAMLADIMLVTGDTGSAMPHLERLQALTQLSQSSLPEKLALADLFRLPGAPALPRDISVDRLSDAEALGLHQQQEAAAWIGELDLEAASVEDDLGWLQEFQEEAGEAGPAAPAEGVPDWLAATTAAVQQPEEAELELPAIVEDEAAESAGWMESAADEAIDWAVAPEERVEAPDWMAGGDDLDWLEQPVEADTPDWLAETEPAEEPDAGLDEAAGATEPALPDWLGEVPETGWQGEAHLAAEKWERGLPEGGSIGEEEGEPAEQEEVAEPAYTERDEHEVWDHEADREGLVMEERGKEQDEQPEAQDDIEEAADLDWLQQLGQPEPTTEPGAKRAEAEAGESGDLPDWLGGEGELEWLDEDEGGAEPERLAAETPADEDLSWLDQIAGGQAEPPEEMPTLEWPDEDELALPEEPELAAPVEDVAPPEGEDVGLDWLDALPAEGDVVTAAWLDDLVEEGELTGASDESKEPHLFSEELGDLDWLEESVEQPDAGEEGDALDWLGAGEMPLPAGDAGEPVEAESFDEGGLDWLTGEAAGETGLEWLTGPESGAAPESDEEATEAVAADVFAAEEAEEPVLDYLEAAPETGDEPVAAAPEPDGTVEAPDVPEELEEAMAWLDDLSAQVEAPEAQDIPEDLDEAMAWLEQLAAQQGAPLEELPSMMAATAAASRGEEPEVAEGQVEQPEQAAILDAAPEPDLPEEEALEPHLEWMEALAEAEVTGAAGPGEDEFDVPADLDEAMAWLEGLTEQEETDSDALADWLQDDEADFGDFVEDEGEAAALFETPEPEAGGEATADELADVPEDLDEALAWLEQLAAQQGAPAEELPSLQEAGPLEEAAEWPIETDEEAAPAMEITPAIETPPAMQVPDVAMMYLDSLLVGGWQQAGKASAAPELTDELPDDAESALAWLEQLATGPATDAPAEAATGPAEEPDTVLDWLREMEAEPGVAEEVEAGEWAWTEELPEPERWEEAEPDAGLPVEAVAGEAEAEVEEWAWTEELPEPEQWEEAEPDAELPVEAVAGEAGAEVEEWAWTEELPEPEQWEEAEPAVDEAAAELPATGQTPEEMFDEIPEDPDEAMAWLERLAARQGAPLEELPSVDEISAEVEMPDWLAREMAEAQPAVPETADAGPASEELDWLEGFEELGWPEDVAVDEAPAELELPDIEESVPEVAPEELAQMEAAFDLDILEGEEMEPALPEWLSGEDDSWPTELSDIDSWLVAEEEASRIDMPVPEPVRPAPAPTARPEPAPTERIAAPEGSDAERLEAARAALDGGDVEAAVAAYHDFMGGGSGLNVVIADLEMATAADEQPMLLRLLGDAYMENGQLNRALEAYRRALDLL